MKKQVKNELLLLCGLGAMSLFATRKYRRYAIFPALAGTLFLLQDSSKECRTGAQSRGLFDRPLLTHPLVGKAHTAEFNLNLH